MIEELFSRYESTARKADYLFKTIQEKYPLSVKCTIRCADCCHAVFGILPIEAAYLHSSLRSVDRKIRRDVLRRAEKAETEMLKVKDALRVFDDNPKMKVYGIGKQRVRCPLLTDKKECVLYDKRPTICRVYGVPYVLKKKKKDHSYVCGLSGFQEKATYATVKLDNLYHELFMLSQELFVTTKAIHPDRANLMVPISRILRMPFEKIMQGDFEE
jgi:Fe-S-cluster containining protein